MGAHMVVVGLCCCGSQRMEGGRAAAEQNSKARGDLLPAACTISLQPPPQTGQLMRRFSRPPAATHAAAPTLPTLLLQQHVCYRNQAPHPVAGTASAQVPPFGGLCVSVNTALVPSRQAAATPSLHECCGVMGEPQQLWHLCLHTTSLLPAAHACQAIPATRPAAGEQLLPQPCSSRPPPCHQYKGLPCPSRPRTSRLSVLPPTPPGPSVTM
jgi:hypothetical protein